MPADTDKARPAPEHREGGTPVELIRLRRRNNMLVRRLADQQQSHNQEARRNRERLESLEREVSALRGSRSRRMANLLRSLDPRGLVRRLIMRNRDRDAGQVAGWRRDHRSAQYRASLERNRPAAADMEKLRQRIRALRRTPLFSVLVPVYRPDPEHLRQALDSVRAQVYENWEVCLVEDAPEDDIVERLLDSLADPRIRAAKMPGHAGISAATNEAMDMARGEFVAFLDHDDMLAPEALAEIATAIDVSGADFVYSDEDYLDGAGTRVYPHFKPDYSPDLLLSHNYITHLVVVSRELAVRIGGLRSEYDGAQDYDFVLRAAEAADNIRHIPLVLYHWRTGQQSSSTNPDSKPLAVERGRKAVADALARRGREGEVSDAGTPHFYRITYRMKQRPLVSIVLPFRDKPEYLHCVVGDILDLSSYGNYEIVGIDNQSEDPETFEAMQDLAGIDDRVGFLEFNEPFNFSAIINYGVAHSRGEHVVVLNNDIRLINADRMEALLAHSQHRDTGAVGGKLYYPDGRVQHAGIVVGIGGYAGHSHKGFPAVHQGYFNRLQVVQNVSAVTGAFMMVKRALYEEIGGFDARNFTVACNDVDFCLRLREKGYWNVFTPYAEAYHVESGSRGYEDTPEKMKRFDSERARFAERHRRILEEGDPFYNRNLTRTAEDFSLHVSG